MPLAGSLAAGEKGQGLGRREKAQGESWVSGLGIWGCGGAIHHGGEHTSGVQGWTGDQAWQMRLKAQRGIPKISTREAIVGRASGKGGGRLTSLLLSVWGSGSLAGTEGSCLC